jgi:hypothetical protein
LPSSATAQCSRVSATGDLRIRPARPILVVVVTTPEWITNTKVQMALSHLRLENAMLVLNKVEGNAGLAATERQFSHQRLSQRVAVPADLQRKTMLDSGTFSLSGLGRSTRVPIKKLGLAVAAQLA